MNNARNVYPLITLKMWFSLLFCIFTLFFTLSMYQYLTFISPSLILLGFSCMGFALLSFFFFYCSYIARKEILDSVFHVEGRIFFRDSTNDHYFKDFVRNYSDKLSVLEQDVRLRLNTALHKDSHFGSIKGPYHFESYSDKPLIMNIINEGHIRLMHNKKMLNFAGLDTVQWIDILWIRPNRTWALMRHKLAHTLLAGAFPGSTISDQHAVMEAAELP